jgi:hypothetical protein
MYARIIEFAKIHFLHLIVITLITLALFWKPISSEGIAWWGDMTPPVLNMQNFKNLSNYLYVEKNSGLVSNPIYIMMYFLLYQVFALLNLVLPKKVLIDIWFLLPYLALYYGIYYAIWLQIKRGALAFLLTLTFIFSTLNFSLIIAGYSTTNYSIVACILFFTIFDLFLKDSKYKYIFLLPLLATVAIMNVAVFYATLVLTSIYFLIILLYTRTTLLSFIKKNSILISTIMFCIILNLFWIIPYFLMSKYDQISFGSINDNIYSSTYQITTPLNNLQLSTTFNSFSDYKDLFSFFNSNFYKFEFFLSLGYIVYKIYFTLRNNKRIPLKLLFIVTFILSLGPLYFPLYSKLNFIPGWFLLRAPIIRFFTFLFFIELVLLGFSVSNKKNHILYGVILLNIILNVIGFTKGDIFNYWENIKPPKDYSAVLTYLSKAERTNKPIMILPEIPANSRVTWVKNHVYWINILDTLLENPIILTKWGRSRVPDYFIPFLEKMIPNYDAASFLGQGGVKYIISQSDMIGFPPWNFDNVKGIDLKIKGSNLKLYEIADSYFRPPITSSNKINFFKLNPSKYYARLKIQHNKTDLTFNTPNGDLWKVYPINVKDFHCKNFKEYKTYNTVWCDDQISSNMIFDYFDVKYLFNKEVSYYNKYNIQGNQTTWQFSNSKNLVNDDSRKKLNASNEEYLYISIVYFPQILFYLGALLSFVGTIILILIVIKYFVSREQK